MNKITEITRRNIFDTLIVEKINLSGRLDELKFLSRIFKLNELPSTDSRFNNAHDDIWQHTINNDDWDLYWVLSYPIFDLLNCEDNKFLAFLCEMIHPIVRNNPDEISLIQQIFNENLSIDNFEIVEKDKSSKRPVFEGKLKSLGKISIDKSRKEIQNILSDEYVHKQIDLMQDSIEKSPDVAIGISKELIESICKTILEERQVTIDKNWDLPQLLKQTTKQLQLTPDEISEQIKASQTIKSILGSLSTVVHGLSELRNQYGSGHGKKANFRGLTQRHAKLAVGAASTLAIFLLETHQFRN